MSSPPGALHPLLPGQGHSHLPELPGSWQADSLLPSANTPQVTPLLPSANRYFLPWGGLCPPGLARLLFLAAVAAGALASPEPEGAGLGWGGSPTSLGESHWLEYLN